MNDSLFAPLGVLEEQVLVAVLFTRDEAYGMHVRREIERVAGRELAIGAVYATLDRLEAKGLLTSRVEAPDRGRPRRFYRVSPRGVRAVRRALAEVERMRDGLDPLLTED